MTKPKVTDCALYLEGAVQAYDGRQVLSGVDLAVRKGEFVTLVGPSGCGKSTLLRLLLGAERPTQGLVAIDGKEKMDPDRDCGIVYQKYSIFPHLTVFENIALGPMLEQNGIIERGAHLPSFRRKRKRILEEAKEFLHMVDLDSATDQYPYQLSGGMQQRVAIAQALIMHPKVLLLDEPFSALDPWTREQLQLYLMGLWQKEAMTVLFVTHDLEEAIFLGTRICVLSQRYETALREGHGSRIIVDFPIPEQHPRAPAFKSSNMLNNLLVRIREIAFDQKTGGGLVHVDGFVLEHPDSFCTA